MKEYFKERNDIGKLIMTVGVITLIPLLVLPFYTEEVHFAWTFLVPGIGSVILGLLICIFAKNTNIRLSWRDNLYNSSLTVLFVWCYGFAASAVPFVLSGQLTPIEALFESISGWTTTGHSVVDVENTAHIFLFHRALIQFIGGLGFVMMMCMIVQNKQSMNLFHAEGHTDNIAPNIKQTARTIFMMFMGFLVMGTFLYRIFGMPIFDGICHSMSALSTAGFSTKAESIGYYDSFAIEAVTMALMIIGIINFALLLMMMRGKFRKVAKVTEVRFGALVLAVGVLLIAFGLCTVTGLSMKEGMRDALFNAVSAMTTTGYATADFSTWPAFSMGIMILLMIIGGGIGSTAGGMKLIRVYVLLEVLWTDIRKRISSKRRIIVVQYRRAQGTVSIDNSMIKEVLSFAFMYVIIFFVGSLCLMLTADCTMQEAMFDFAASLGDVGLTSGITGAHSSNGTLIVEMVGMVLGRLEIFIVIVGIYGAVMKVKNRAVKMAKRLTSQ